MQTRTCVCACVCVCVCVCVVVCVDGVQPQKAQKKRLASRNQTQTDPHQTPGAPGSGDGDGDHSTAGGTNDFTQCISAMCVNFVIPSTIRSPHCESGEEGRNGPHYIGTRFLNHWSYLLFGEGWSYSGGVFSYLIRVLTPNKPLTWLFPTDNFPQKNYPFFISPTRLLT